MPPIVVKDSGLVFARRVVPSPDVVKRFSVCFGTGEEDVVVAAAVVRRIEITGVVACGCHLAHDVEVIAKVKCVLHFFVSADAISLQ